MTYPERFQKIMAEYYMAVQEVQGKRKFFDGLLGMGNHPGNAACHEAMDRQVMDLCREAAGEAGPEEAAGLIREIYGAEEKWHGPEYARLMLLAVQRHTMTMIDRLEEKDRQEMARQYAKRYPRRKRLPVQDQILERLMNA